LENLKGTTFKRGDNVNFIWYSFILILAGILLLRIAGRKSISQMTLAQTVVMISIGTIIVQPIVEKSVVKAIVAAAIFVISPHPGIHRTKVKCLRKIYYRQIQDCYQ
jgi:uncharacterized membrane protein YcaP (DUF421 family)